MSEMKKDTFMQKMKNKGLVYASALVIAGSTGLVLLARGCPGSGVFAERPTLCEPVRGDGICCESESYPFERNPNGTIKMRGQDPVPNKAYSLEDCHNGDNRCQSQSSLADLRDAADRPVPRLMDKFLDGRPIALPLENEASPDCVMQAVRDAPCAALDAQNPQTINRPRMTGPRVLHNLRQRSQPEIEQMHMHPESLRLGDNYFVVMNNYEETCDATRPVCTPEMVEACFCPNHVECAPAPCGNGRIDSGERCDGSAAPTGCGPSTRCNSTCTTCNPAKRCGNGQIDPGERCDSSATPTGCGAGQSCAPGCKQCTGGETHSACRSEQCVSVPGPGRNACSTDEDCATEVPPPPPPQVGQCDGEVTARFQNRVSSTLLGSPGPARSAADTGGTANDKTVRATVSINIASGVANVTGITVSCADCSGGSLPASSINVGGIPIDRSTTCRTTVVVNIPPG
ncbi:hypothetical protein L0Y65_04050 [Candidatus Micrarchaeota archaeon]|nr:hypothetical protein [Candidatus Micrarchaeota archaeon]